MKKVIVTGGLGFIGSNLVNILIKKKYFVINIDKVTYSSNFYNVRNLLKNKNYKFIKLDINNSKKTFQILKKYKPHVIFNLAAETHVDRSIDKPENFNQSIIVGVYNLLEGFKDLTKKNKSKLIHISTDEVYGDVLSGRSSENYPYQPSSPYAASKWAVIGVTKTLAMELGKFKIRVNAICPGTIKGDRMNRVISAKAKFLKVPKKFVEKEYISMTSMNTWIYEEDIAKTCGYLISDDALRVSGQVISIDGNTFRMD